MIAVGPRVGYRFEIAGRWAEPGENLEKGRSYDAELQSASGEIDTAFKAVSGDDCGKYRVRFLNTQIEGPIRRHYVVDNPDLPVSSQPS